MYNIEYWIGGRCVETLGYGKPLALCLHIIKTKSANGYTKKNFKLTKYEKTN